MQAHMKRYLGMHAGLFIASIAFSLASAICAILPYLVSAGMITRLVNGSRDMADFAPDLWLLAALLVGSNLFHKLSTGMSHVATFDVLASMRKDLCNKLSRVPLGVVDDYGSGKLKDIMVEKVDKMETTFAHVIPEMIGNVLVFILTLIYLFILDWRLALAGLIVVPFSIGVYSMKIKTHQMRFNNYLQKNAVLNTTIVEYINGIEVIKAFNQSGKAYARLVVACKEAAHSAIDWMNENLLGFAVLFVFLPSGILTVVPIGAMLYMNGSLSTEVFFTSLLATFGLVQPLLIAAAHADSLAEVGTLFGMIAKILDREELERPETGAPLKSGDIRFEHVSFAYNDMPVLEDVNLCFKENTVNALVGPSGGGKSTITKLLAGFYEAGEGTISIGGRSIKDVPLAEWNSKIAYVSQKDYLFDRTIRENLEMGRPGVTFEEIVDICKRSGVHDFISSLPNGYDTVVGTAGAQLSGGERQRISIARAMIKDAPIVIFDEATAYTDPENEYLIQRSVSELIRGKTLIVVAHRLSTITDSDRIFLIDGKKVACEGTHDELMERSPLYRELYEAHMEVKDRREAC